MDNKQPSPSSSKKHETEIICGNFRQMNDDLLQNILSRLPALSFASAACVSKSWNKVCNRILTRPKIASALSLNPRPQIALKDVADKVLSNPIRPHFAIANVGRGFNLKRTLKFLTKMLGSQTPIIVSSTGGIIGREALTDGFREVKFEGDDVLGDNFEARANNLNSGIVLTVGFMPGLKIDCIPLLRPKGSQVAMVDQFVMDIMNYTASVSGCTSPVGVIVFGDGATDQKYIIEKLDYAMPVETAIVGDERSQFLYRSGNDLRNVCESPEFYSDSVALVFAKDQDKPQGTGEIQFHVALSKGVSAIGPRYKAVSVRANECDRATWITARREGQQEILDGQQILNDLNNELENRIDCPELYIGVTKRRKCCIGSEKSRIITSLAFHGVDGGDEEYLYADGVGIRSGDYFQFYHPDPNIASTACRNVSLNLKNLKQDYDSRTYLHTRKELLGGFIFSCCGRGDSFFGSRNVDSSPFLENFPEVPLAGIFCGGEIGRESPSLIGQESKEEIPGRCCLHVYSAVYLVMSYTPAS